MSALPDLDVIEAELTRRGLPVEKAIPGGPDRVTVAIAVSSLETAMQRIFKDAMHQVANDLPLTDLRHAIISGHWQGVFAEAVKPAIKQQLSAGAIPAFRAAHLKGALIGLRQLAPMGVQLRSATIAFDLVNAQAVQWALTHAGLLITGVTDSQIEAAQVLVAQALQQGRTVDQVARDLRLIIGLRPDQVDALLAFNSRLVEQDIPVDRIEARTERYANALLSQRATLIARTEIISSANGGRRDLWDAAADQGLFNRNTAMKVWVATEDELLCLVCEGLDGEKVGMDEQFETDDGPVDGPVAHPQCRCGLNIEFHE